MIAAYVINLDRMPERKAQFFAHPDAHHFTRVSAVDRLDLEKLPYLKDYLFDSRYILQRYPIRTAVSLGEIGCTLSHIECWKRIVQRDDLADDDYAIVAEDDIVLVPNFVEIWHKFLLNPIVAKKHYDLIILHKLGINSDQFINWQPEFATLESELQCGYLTPYKNFDSDGSALYMIKKSLAQEILTRLQDSKPFWLADIFTAFCAGEKIGLAHPMFGWISDQNKSDLSDERLAHINIVN